MKCRPEEELDAAVIRLVDRGFRGPWGSRSELSEAGSEAEAGISQVEAEFPGLFRHLRECVRCRELFEVLLETEVGLRGARHLPRTSTEAHDLRRTSTGVDDPPQTSTKADDPAGTSTGAKEHAQVSPERRSRAVLRLVPLPDRSARERAGVDDAPVHQIPRDLADYGPAAESYPIAADSNPLQPPPGGHPGGTPVLTLSSSDGRYLVRIFPNQTGGGATAVLMRESRTAGAEQEPPGSNRRSDAEARTVHLRVSGREYAFDANDYAFLPEFPAQDVELILPEE